MSHNLYRVLVLVPALVGTAAHALGIGGIRQQSALDQPFVGEIDLVDVKPDELDAVKVQIAPQADFSRSGTERYHYLTKLRFTPQISPRGNPVVRVSSREPMREPYMDFLVEVVWPKGRLVKQYTVLLDPPATTARTAPRVAQPVVDARPAAAPATVAQTAAPAPARAAKPPAPPPAAASASSVEPPRSLPAPTGGGTRRIGPIRPGAGLWRLARNNTPPGATVSQTAMALYRNNQGAFINGDINRLIAGKTLTMPHAGELFALNPETAKREFAAAIRGEQVRRTLIADANAPAAPPGQGESRLRIAGASADAAKRGSAGPGRGGADGEGMEKELLLVRETSESARQETVELRTRIHDLESQLAEIQQLLTMRNEELARVQGGAGSAPGVKVASATGGQDARPAPSGTAPPAGVSAPPAGVSAPPTGVSAPKPLPGDLKEPLSAKGGMPPEGRASAPAGSSGGAPAVPPPASGPGVAGVTPPGAEATVQPGPDTKPAATIAVSPSRPPSAAGTGLPVKATVGPGTQVAVAPASGGESAWRGWWLPLAGVAGVAALGIGGLFWMRSRRRVGRDSSVEFDSADLAGETITPALRSAADAAAAGSVSGAGSGAGSVAGSISGPMSGSKGRGAGSSGGGGGSSTGSGMFDPAETDEADAVSEADIYIAYGRYREAEDLLREEIQRTPERLELKFKLAEAYYGAKNTGALRGLMQEVRADGGDQSNPAQWQRLVEMAAVTPSDASSEGLPASARPPVQGGVGGGKGAVPVGGVLVESVDTGSADAYTLDISDARKPSADLAMFAEPDTLPGFGDSAGSQPGGRPASGAPPGLPLSGGGPSQSGPRSGPRSDQATLRDERAFSPALDLGKGSAFRGSDQSSRPVSGAGAAGGFPEFDLNQAEPRPSNDLELYPVADLTSPGRSGDGVGRAVADDLPVPSRPGNAWTELMDPRTTPAPTGSAARSGAPEDSGSSDLLSSHWQLDSGLWDETATKLDLARAYIEMGDKESAKGILEEVAGEGSDEQRAEAGELLRRAT